MTKNLKVFQEIRFEYCGCFASQTPTKDQGLGRHWGLRHTGPLRLVRNRRSNKKTIFWDGLPQSLLEIASIKVCRLPIGEVSSAPPPPPPPCIRIGWRRTIPCLTLFFISLDRNNICHTRMTNYKPLLASEVTLPTKKWLNLTKKGPFFWNGMSVSNDYF